jgi:hypothetical protein
MLQFDEDVLQCFVNNAIGVNSHLMWNVEGQQQFYPFQWQKVQALGSNDYLCRDQFIG